MSTVTVTTELCGTNLESNVETEPEPEPEPESESETEDEDSCDCGYETEEYDSPLQLKYDETLMSELDSLYQKKLDCVITDIYKNNIVRERQDFGLSKNRKYKRLRDLVIEYDEIVNGYKKFKRD
jgi:hypothetical protein